MTDFLRCARDGFITLVGKTARTVTVERRGHNGNRALEIARIIRRKPKTEQFKCYCHLKDPFLGRLEPYQKSAGISISYLLCHFIYVARPHRDNEVPVVIGKQLVADEVE